MCTALRTTILGLQCNCDMVSSAVVLYILVPPTWTLPFLTRDAPLYVPLAHPHGAYFMGSTADRVHSKVCVAMVASCHSCAAPQSKDQHGSKFHGVQRHAAAATGQPCRAADTAIVLHS